MNTWNAVRAGTMAVAMAAAITFFSGCGKDNPTSAAAEASSTEDAAESIASTVGQDDGGVFDQMSDVSEIASAAGITESATQQKGGDHIDAATMDTSYNASTGTWTLMLSRQRGTGTGSAYASITRVYQYTFLNKDGQAQKYWRVPNNGGGTDTAYSITFKIVSGAGAHHTARVSQSLKSIGGAWTITGVNTGTLTINGTYNRSAVDTLTTRNAVRTLDHTLNLTFVNVQVPRGSRADLATHATGTINGTYAATITFTRGALYNDRDVTRDFSVTLGSGKANILINGKGFNGLLKSGELTI